VFVIEVPLLRFITKAKAESVFGRLEFRKLTADLESDSIMMLRGLRRIMDQLPIFQKNIVE